MVLPIITGEEADLITRQLMALPNGGSMEVVFITAGGTPETYTLTKTKTQVYEQKPMEIKMSRDSLNRSLLRLGKAAMDNLPEVFIEHELAIVVKRFGIFKILYRIWRLK
jgi:hypothetical protein